MTTSFNPSLGEFVLDAFGNCGIKRTELSSQHFADARFAANLINARWSASGVNLWTVDQQTTTLFQATGTYAIPTDTVFILDAYLSTQDSGGNVTDTLIFPISRSDYAALANKQSQGTPTVFWFDRTLSPNLYLWQVPDQSGVWTLKYWRARQIADSNLAGAQTVEIPFRFLDAYSWELSWRLAAKYAPDKAVILRQAAKEAWDLAVSSDTENVPLKVTPAVAGYFR